MLPRRRTTVAGSTRFKSPPRCSRPSLPRTTSWWLLGRSKGCRLTIHYLGRYETLCLQILRRSWRRRTTIKPWPDRFLDYSFQVNLYAASPQSFMISSEQYVWLALNWSGRNYILHRSTRENVNPVWYLWLSRYVPIWSVVWSTLQVCVRVKSLQKQLQWSTRQAFPWRNPLKVEGIPWVGDLKSILSLLYKCKCQWRTHWTIGMTMRSPRFEYSISYVVWGFSPRALDVTYHISDAIIFEDTEGCLETTWI